MDLEKKIKLKSSVLLKIDKRQAWALDPSTDTIVKFSQGMAKIMGILDENMRSEKSGVTLIAMQKELTGSSSSKSKQVTRKTVQAAVQLLSKLNLLVGSKGAARLVDRRLGARKKEVSLRGFGKVIVTSGATVLASGAMFLGGAESAAAHTRCTKCAAACQVYPAILAMLGIGYAPHVIHSYRSYPLSAKQGFCDCGSRYYAGSPVGTLCWTT